MVDQPPLGLNRLRISLDRLPVEVPALADARFELEVELVYVVAGRLQQSPSEYDPGEALRRDQL